MQGRKTKRRQERELKNGAKGNEQAIERALEVLELLDRIKEEKR